MSDGRSLSPQIRCSAIRQGSGLNLSSQAFLARTLRLLRPAPAFYSNDRGGAL